MGGRVASLNVGRIERHAFRGKTLTTGFIKRPVEGRLRIREPFFEGDEHAVKYLREGFPNDKAAYAYGLDDYAWFAQTYGIQPEPALFGENLTIEGLDVSGWVVGDRWRIGTATLEVSEPRLPCVKFGWRMNDVKWVGIFARALRPGAYLRIVEPGDVGAGDAVELLSRPDHGLTVSEVMRIRLYAPQERDKLAAAEALPFNYHAWMRGGRDILNGP